MTPPRRTVLVSTAGEVLPGGHLSAAVHGDVEWSVGSTPTRWQVTLPVNDPGASAVLAEKFREAQLWRGDRLLTWGPCVNPRVDTTTGVLTVDGYDILWYLDRRQIGPDVRNNLVTNGDWTGGLTSWTVKVTDAIGTWGPTAAGCTAEASTHPVTGAATLKITDTTDLAPTDLNQPFVWQELTVKQPGDTSPGGISAGAFPRDLTVSALAYIPDADWLGPGDHEVGLRVARYPEGWDAATATPFYDDGNAYVAQLDAGASSIRGDHERDKDVPHSATITIPPAWGGRVLVQLWGPRGVVHWGPVLVDLDDGLEYAGEDQAEIVRKTVDQVTGNPSVVGFPGDLPYYAAGSDLNIDVVSSLTGVTRNRRFMYAQRASALRSLAELADYDDGVELVATYPTATTRAVTVAYPKQGQDRPDVIFRIGTHSNVQAAVWSWAGDEAASSVIVLGPGGNLSRLEGNATDTSGWAEALTLPVTRQAQLDAPVDKAALDAQAATHLEVVKDPHRLQVRVPADGWIDRIDCGDRVRVNINTGHLTHQATMRIVRLRLTADDWLQVELEPWTGA